MARPTKLTPALHAAIIRAVQHGVPYVRAALLAGVGERTAHQWRARGAGTDGRKPTPVYVQFAQDIEKAQAQDEAARILRITQAAMGGAVLFERTITYPDGRVVHEVRRTRPEWTADAWVLERSRPEQWGRKQQVDMRVQQADIEAAAAVVAAELGNGITAEQVIDEAQRILRKADAAARRPPLG